MADINNLDIEELYAAYEAYEELDSYIVQYKIDLFNILENLSVLQPFKGNIQFEIELNEFKRKADDFQEFLNKVLEHLSDEIEPIIEAIEDFENLDDEN